MRNAARALALWGSLVLLGAHRPVTVFDLSDAVGKQPPAFSLVQSSGAPLDLSALRGEPAYVFLFASWCGPCRQAFPFVREAYARYGARVHFVGVDVLDTDDAARAEVAAQGFPFPVAIFPMSELDALVSPYAQLQAGSKYKIPADFLLDADGVVRYAWHGLAMNDDGTPVDVLSDYFAKLGVR